MARLVIVNSGTGSGAGVSIPYTSVDPATGNFLINGAPTLMISGSKQSYGWWGSAGYSTAAQDAKFAEMVTNGFNAVVGDEFQHYSATYQDLQMWNLHGLYATGTAADDLTHDACGGASPCSALSSYWLPSGDATVTTVVSFYKNRINLLGWNLAHELTGGGVPSGPQYGHGVTTVKTADSSRTIIELISYITSSNIASYIGPGLIDVPLLELIVGGDYRGHLQDALLSIKAMLDAATVFCPAFSTTPLTELINGSGPIVLTQTQLFWYFMLQVARDVRWFDVLWGPNQRDGPASITQLSQASTVTVVSDTVGDTRQVEIDGNVSGVYTQEFVSLNGQTPVPSVNTYDTNGFGCVRFTGQNVVGAHNVTVSQTAGDAHQIGQTGTGRGLFAPGSLGAGFSPGEGMPFGYVTVRNRVLTILSQIKSLSGVILAPGRWTALTTNNAYSYSSGFFSHGVYAAKKAYGGVTYVIAANMEYETASVILEVPLTGVTITVGTGTVCTPIFGTPTPTSFSGGVITTDIAAGAAYIYQVT